MQYIFPIEKSAFGFTCRECGAVTGQKSGVSLNPYLVVTTFTNSDKVLRYAEEMVCDGCVKGIKSLALGRGKVRDENFVIDVRPILRIQSSELSDFGRMPACEWPFTAVINGHHVTRNCSIPSWTRDPDAQFGYVYDNNNVVFFIFEDSN